VYNLSAVTYGTASAPFLATRCLKQLVDEKEQLYSKAVDIVCQDFYVDNLLSVDGSRGQKTTKRNLVTLVRSWFSNVEGIFQQ
jgi:hypothetical protein